MEKVSHSKHSSHNRNKVIDNKTMNEYRQEMKTQVNLQMTLTKEETIGLQAIFVKRADILNDYRIETGYHWKK